MIQRNTFLGVYETCTYMRHILRELIVTFIKMILNALSRKLSGWPSGLRRQTQGTTFNSASSWITEVSDLQLKARVRIPLLTDVYSFVSCLRYLLHDVIHNTAAFLVISMHLGRSKVI